MKLIKTWMSVRVLASSIHFSSDVLGSYNSLIYYWAHCCLVFALHWIFKITFFVTLLLIHLCFGLRYNQLVTIGSVSVEGMDRYINISTVIIKQQTSWFKRNLCFNLALPSLLLFSIKSIDFMNGTFLLYIYVVEW